jgi:Kef-type K+ transport system membrane component KefB
MIFLPALPLHTNVITLFGLTLILGLIGGELARRIPLLPTISGYIAIGFIFGPGGFNIISPSVVADTRLFVDISLGLILFEVGRQLDLTWLRYDYGILLASIAESSFSFIAVLLFMHYQLSIGWLPSAIAGSFAMATSPAVIMMVSNDLSAQGPVTRRTKLLTSLNNLFALLTFTTLLPFTISEKTKSAVSVFHIAYLLGGPLALAFVMLIIIRLIATLTGKHRENQFALFIGAIITTIGMAKALLLPTALTLFLFGVLTRNLDWRHALLELNFGWSARIFLILLFVITGTYLQLDALKTATIAVIIFILLRSLAISTGIFMFSRLSRLSYKQAFYIGLALTPMAGLTISMSNVLDDFNPDIYRQISTIIAAAVAILQILGPIATQLAFIWSKESEPTK